MSAGYNGATEHDPGFLRRMWAMVVKEFVQMRRDRLTFATMIFVPILQLTLFGYAINTDPKQSAHGGAGARRWPADPRRAGGDEEHRLFRFPLAGARSRGARQADQIAAMRNSASRFRRASSATCGAATGPPCW